jgi:hypothetical protein
MATLVPLALGILMSTAADAPDLVFESKIARRKDEILVTFYLRNRGTPDLRVLLENYYCNFETRLFDRQGVERIPWDQRATQGARAEPLRVTPAPLPAGGRLEVGYFLLSPKRRNAFSGPLNWNLERVPAQTFSVEFTVRMPREMADRAALRGGSGIIVGEWTSPRVAVSYDPD